MIKTQDYIGKKIALLRISIQLMNFLKAQNMGKKYFYLKSVSNCCIC